MEAPALDPTLVQAQQVENLRAFAVLYALVRFFHPSDEASAVDWDAFAVHGVARVRDLPDAVTLRAELARMFSPIAPTVQIYREGEPRADPARLTPADTAGLTVVAWQHVGLGLGGGRSIYRSKRTDRTTTLSLASWGFGTATNAIDAGPVRGHRVRMTAAVRAEPSGPSSAAQLWLRVDREKDQSGFFDNMADRPIRSGTWASYEISGPVADDATKVVFGVMLSGRGLVEADEFKLEVEDDAGGWRPVELRNPGFEAGTRDWRCGSDGYAYTVETTGARAGKQSLRLTDARETIGKEPLFSAVPAVGEVVDASLGQRLMVQVPLALYSKDGHTLGQPEAALAALHADLEAAKRKIASADALADIDVRLADIVIVWAMMRHFYPYFDLVRTDWDEAFAVALHATLGGGDDVAFVAVLRRFMAALEDGHGYISAPTDYGQKYLPIKLDWIDGAVVVTASADPKVVAPGDEVVRIGDEDVVERLANARELVSGSPQWKQHLAAGALVRGPVGTKVVVSFVGMHGPFTRTLEYTADAPPEETRPPSIVRRPDGIFYVDLTRASWQEVAPKVAMLARAPGVVFDLRGYPAGNHAILSHLLRTPDKSRNWMKIPHIIRPYAAPVEYEDEGWDLAMKRPHIGGKVAFLTDVGAISYAESVMGLVAHHRLGEIVGSPTAGTNGNINTAQLPGDIDVTWTGMRVVRHDGGQHHLLGVQPTIPAAPTLEGVRAGRDEVLEAGLRAVGADMTRPTSTP